MSLELFYSVRWTTFWEAWLVKAKILNHYLGSYTPSKLYVFGGLFFFLCFVLYVIADALLSSLFSFVSCVPSYFFNFSWYHLNNLVNKILKLHVLFDRKLLALYTFLVLILMCLIFICIISSFFLFFYFSNF